MIRLILISVVFCASTLGLLAVLAPAPDEAESPQQVTRAEPSGQAFDLTPVVRNEPVAAAPETVQAPAVAPSPEPTSAAATAPVVHPTTTPEPVTTTAATDTMQTLRNMSYGLLGQTPSAPDTAPGETVRAVPAAPAPQLAPATAPSVIRYIVQDGDSLSGIAYRHFGSTAAYIQLLAANDDQLRSPADLRPGMILSIPRTP